METIDDIEKYDNLQRRMAIMSHNAKVLYFYLNTPQSCCGDADN